MEHFNKNTDKDQVSVLINRIKACFFFFTLVKIATWWWWKGMDREVWERASKGLHLEGSQKEAAGMCCECSHKTRALPVDHGLNGLAWTSQQFP